MDRIHHEGVKDRDGIFRHELVGERLASARAFALGARVKRDDPVTRAHDLIDHGTEDAVLLAVAVQHEDGWPRCGPLFGFVDKSRDQSAIVRRDVPRQHGRRGRRRVGAGEVTLGDTYAHAIAA